MRLIVTVARWILARHIRLNMLDFLSDSWWWLPQDCCVAEDGVYYLDLYLRRGIFYVQDQMVEFGRLVGAAGLAEPFRERPGLLQRRFDGLALLLDLVPETGQRLIEKLGDLFEFIARAQTH